MAETPVIKFPDGTVIEVVDPDNVAPVFADLITEFREVDGVVYLSLACVIVDGDEGGRRARVVSRIRMGRGRVSTLYGFLGNLLAPDEPTTKEQIN